MFPDRSVTHVPGSYRVGYWVLGIGCWVLGYRVVLRGGSRTSPTERHPERSEGSENVAGALPDVAMAMVVGGTGASDRPCRFP